MSAEDRRQQQDRRPAARDGGRRATDSWSPSRLAAHIGMSSDFVVDEIRAGEIKASQFGREFRITVEEVTRYLRAKGWPLPDVA